MMQGKWYTLGALVLFSALFAVSSGQVSFGQGLTADEPPIEPPQPTETPLPSPSPTPGKFHLG